MSTPYFDFKQFRIRHDRCGLKVGTDGVLLGAWATLPQQGHILDIGTGSGLIALMAAQRAPLVNICAIDIEANAIEQARENVAASPFADRIKLYHLSLHELCHSEFSLSPTLFNCILCNPPFFEESLLPPDAARTAARHTCSLPFSELATDSAALLTEGGTLNIILPTSAFDDFHRLCIAEGLSLQTRCDIRTTPRKAPKRTLATFVKGTFVQPVTTELVLQDGTARSAAYSTLTEDFYLH